MMQIDTLLVDVGPGETRVAALADDDVVEIYHHRVGMPGAGALYNGRVGKPLPDGSAVFVDIGLESPAFLPCGSKPPPEGTAIIVDVVQPPRGDKGAKVRRADDDTKAAALGDKTLPSQGLIQAAKHPIRWCADHYANTLSRVVVTPRDEDNRIKEMVSTDVAVEVWKNTDDLFEYFGVDEAIERAVTPEVPFAGGGKLIIEATAALTAVDVDAGPMPAQDANRAALKALARQLRLRAIAGPVIVDLIPSRGRQRLVDQFKQGVAYDPVPTQVAGLTPEGRIEFNRRRVRPSLGDLLLEAPRFGEPATDAVAYAALRRCVRQGFQTKATSLCLKAHGDVVALLQSRLRPALDDAESALKMSIALESVPGVERAWMDIET